MGTSEEGADLQRQIDDLAAQVAANREMIGELQLQGLVSEEHAAQLEEALQSSRTIGAAIGIIMSTTQVDQDAAFAILTKASQDNNRKLRDLAREVVECGGLRPLSADVPRPGPSERPATA